MILVKNNGTHSEFDLWCIAYDVEVGDTLVVGAKSGALELGLFVGYDENDYPKITLQSGESLVVNPETMCIAGRSRRKVIKKSSVPLFLKNLRKDAQ